MTPKVIFGHMHEDHSVELKLAREGGRALVVASGGDLAFSLIGSGVHVLAVDTNPSQIGLVQEKLELAHEHSPQETAGWFIGNATSAPIRNGAIRRRNLRRGLCFCGRVDAVLRAIGPLVSRTAAVATRERNGARRTVLRLLQWGVRNGVRIIHGRRAYEALDSITIDRMLCRIGSAMRSGESDNNPLLQVLLGNGFGNATPDVWTPQGISRWKDRKDLLELEVSSIEDVLIRLPEESMDLISISNIVDMMSIEQWKSLCMDVERVLTPGGHLIARSMLVEELPLPSSCTILRRIPNQSKDISPLCRLVFVGQC